MIPDFQSTLVFRFVKLCSALKSFGNVEFCLQ